jgi:hypothetical protein
VRDNFSRVNKKIHGLKGVVEKKKITVLYSDPESGSGRIENIVYK